MRTYAYLTIFQSEVSGPIPHTRINVYIRRHYACIPHATVANFNESQTLRIRKNTMKDEEWMTNRKQTCLKIWKFIYLEIYPQFRFIQKYKSPEILITLCSLGPKVWSILTYWIITNVIIPYLMKNKLSNNFIEKYIYITIILIFKKFFFITVFSKKMQTLRIIILMIKAI